MSSCLIVYYIRSLCVQGKPAFSVLKNVLAKRHNTAALDPQSDLALSKLIRLAKNLCTEKLYT